VFTQNRFCAAPVLLCRKNIRNAVARSSSTPANANAEPARIGLARAAKVCEAVGKAVGCKSGEVLPFSTGVIMEPLPSDRNRRRALQDPGRGLALGGRSHHDHGYRA